MEDLDDFGDLYADVEVHVSAGIWGVDQLCVDDRKSKDCNLNEQFDPNSQKKDFEVDLGSEKLSDRVCKLSGGDDKKDGDGEGSKVPNSVPGDGNLVVEDGSDSEDDLHIVLNEDECGTIPVSGGAGGGSGEMPTRSDDEDGNDDLVIVTEGDHPNKDQRAVDGFEPNVGCPASDRAKASKRSYVPQFSQFKYVRHRAAAFLGNSKVSGTGGAVSLSSPKSGRSEWDVDGGNRAIMSRPGSDSQTCNLVIPARTQKGCDFHLPRNRTILDVNIEAFEWKPWRRPGVEISDFFNFGLDEESWKKYCNSLEQYRQQNTMLTKIPVYESSRPNQAYEVEFIRKTVSSNAASGNNNIAQLHLEDRATSTSQDPAQGDIPKGRVIRVEGGISERRPSIDVRRARYRDSDVVIQIPMQGSTEDSSASREEDVEQEVMSLGDVDEPGARRTKNNINKQQCGISDGDVVGGLHDEAIDSAIKESCGQLENIDDGDAENFSKVGKDMLEANSVSCNPIHCEFSPSHHGHCKALKAMTAVGMDKTIYLARRPSSSSISESENNQSSDSRSNNSQTEQKGKNDSSQEHSLNQEDWDSTCGARLRSVAKIEIPVNSSKAASRTGHKGYYEAQHLQRGTRKWSQHNCHYDDNNGNEDFCDYKEKEMMRNCRGKHFGEHLGKGNSYAEVVYRKYEREPHLREDMRACVSGDWVRRGYHGRIGKEEDDLKERAHYFHDNRRRKESQLHYSEDSSLHENMERFLQQRRSNNGSQFGQGADDDDFVVECRYREEPFQGSYEKDILYHEKEEDFIHERYGRRASLFEKDKMRSDRRKRDDRSPSFDLDVPWREIEFGDICVGRPSYRPFPSQTCRRFQIKYGREWRDTSPARNRMYDSGRCNGRDEENGRYKEISPEYRRMPDLLEKHYTKHREHENIFSKGKEQYYRSCLRGDIDFDDDSYPGCGRPIYTSNVIHDQRKRYRRWETDYEEKFWHQDGHVHQEDSYLFGRSSRHEHCFEDHDSAHDRNIDDLWYERIQEKIIVGRSVNCEARKHILADCDNHNKAAFLRCKEPLDMHLNGWGRKRPQRCAEAEVRCSRYGNITTHGGNDDCKDLSHSNKVITKEVASTKVDSNCLHGLSSKVQSRTLVGHDDCKALRHCNRSITTEVASSKVDSNHLHGISSQPQSVGHCNSDDFIDISKEKWLDKYPIARDQDASVLEEGELPQETETNDGNQLREQVIDKGASCPTIERNQSESAKDKSQIKDAIGGGKIVGGFNNNRILEMMAKMEMRRERFKNPIAPKKEPDKALQLQSDVFVETAEDKQQRPARKRRWGCS